MGACMAKADGASITPAGLARTSHGSAIHGVGVGEAVDLNTREQMEKLGAEVSSLKATVAQLNQAVSTLQRENDTMRDQMSSLKSNLEARKPHCTSEASTLPGGWKETSPHEAYPSTSTLPQLQPARSIGPFRPPSSNSTAGAAAAGAAAAATAAAATAATAAASTVAVARLEVQLSEIVNRLHVAESQLSGLNSVKEGWEAQRAAQEFAKQLKKLEQVGIPNPFTPSVRGSRPTSGCSTAAVSIADDFPTLEGLPQGRYPRSLAAQPGQRPSARRREPEGRGRSQTPPGSGGGGGYQLDPSRPSARNRMAPAPADFNMPSSNFFSQQSSGQSRAGGQALNGSRGTANDLNQATFKDVLLPNSGSNNGAASTCSSGFSNSPNQMYRSPGELSSQPETNPTPSPGNLNSTTKYGNIMPSDFKLAEQIRRGSPSMLGGTGPKQGFV